MRRVKLTVAYDGTAYVGWQMQPNGTTVQSVMEDVFSRILQEPVRLRAAGRTDAGVHAREQVADFADAGKRDHFDDHPRRERAAAAGYPHPFRGGGSGDVRREAARDGEGVPVLPAPFSRRLPVPLPLRLAHRGGA